MRNAFAEALYECAMADPRIYIVVADISPVGSMAKFREKYPERFINAGVAEQAMTGIATGLALRGMRVFTYTIAPFALYRPFEFVRHIAYQNLPVTIVGMGAGASYASLGGTHQAIEDVGLACGLPNMTVLAPCDPNEVAAAVRWCASEASGPVYLRLGKTGEPCLGGEQWEYGRPRFLRRGRDRDVLILTYGPIAKLAMDVAEKLDASVLSVHTLKPLPIQELAHLMFFYKRNVVIEEHVYQGGLAQQLKMHVKSFHLQDRFSHCHGTREEYLDEHGLTLEKILWEIGYETRA